MYVRAAIASTCDLFLTVRGLCAGVANDYQPAKALTDELLPVRWQHFHAAVHAAVISRGCVTKRKRPAGRAHRAWSASGAKAPKRLVYTTVLLIRP
jgi:hypothetical protein